VHSLECRDGADDAEKEGGLLPDFRNEFVEIAGLRRRCAR
jgi:hypothetical protein